MIYLIVTCKKCDGSGWLYHSECESICEHDRLCGQCGGSGYVPERQTGLAAFTAQTFANHFSTRREAAEFLADTY